jgi:hypothetical protein
VLYSEEKAEAAVRAIAKEVEAAAPCSFEYHPRTRAMLVTFGSAQAYAVVEFTEQRMVSAFGLSTSPRDIDQERRAAMKQEFEVASRATRSAAAWAKGRYGMGLKKIAIAEYSTATRTAARAEAFANGERMVLVYAGDECHTLWRDTAGRMTELDI